jgi:hypothetical protein
MSETLPPKVVYTIWEEDYDKVISAINSSRELCSMAGSYNKTKQKPQVSKIVTCT